MTFKLINEESFNQSMEYYADYPEKLYKIYKNVKSHIQEKDLQIPHINDNDSTSKKKEIIAASIDSLQPFSKKKTP